MSKVQEILNNLQEELMTTSDKAVYSRNNILNIVNLLLYEYEMENKTDRILHWIPVSDKLPENVGDYIVSTKDGDVMEVTYKSDGNFYLVDAMDDFLLESVIAWMLLPNAYKSEIKCDEGIMRL